MNSTIYASSNDQDLWQMIFRFSLRQCCGRHADAEDLTQDVFFRLVANGALERYRSSTENVGHFMALLRVTTRRLNCSARRRDQAEKRLGWTERVSLDDESSIVPLASGRAGEARDYQTLERLAAESESILEQEYRQRGQAELFVALKPTLVPDASEGETCYANLAAGVRKSEGALRVAVSRARKRFRQIVRERMAALETPAPRTTHTISPRP